MSTVIIIGGNSGLGYECARALLENPSWHVVLACRDPAQAQGAVDCLREGSARAGGLPSRVEA